MIITSQMFLWIIKSSEKENVMKKKIVSLFLVGAMVAATAVGCGSVKTDNEAGGSDSGEKAAGKPAARERLIH